MKTLLREIQKAGVLPASYFSSRAFPKTLATEAPDRVVAEFKAIVEQWATWYPQDIGTPSYSDLKRIYQLCEKRPEGES